MEIVNLGVSILALVLVFVLFRKLSRLQKFQKQFFASSGNVNLEDVVLSQQENIKRVVLDIQKLSEANRILASMEQQCIQKVGMIRFNTFQNEGGNQSFAIALLDAFGTGIVISSIYGRESQRVFAKPIKNNESHILLTEEEKQAILECQEIEAVEEGATKQIPSASEKLNIKHFRRGIKRKK